MYYLPLQEVARYDALITIVNTAAQQHHEGQGQSQHPGAASVKH